MKNKRRDGGTKKMGERVEGWRGEKRIRGGMGGTTENRMVAWRLGRVIEECKEEKTRGKHEAVSKNMRKRE